MQRKVISVDELHKMEFELNEIKDELDPALFDIMMLAIDLLRPTTEMEVPMTTELVAVLAPFVKQEMPWIDERVAPWWHRWLIEIVNHVSSSMAMELTQLKYSTEEEIKKLYSANFEWMVLHYTEPLLPKMREMIDFSSMPFWSNLNEEQKKDVLDDNKADMEEEYEERRVYCEAFNNRKKRFLNIVQPIVFQYIGDLSESFDLSMWQHYGIMVGCAFEELEELCSDIVYYYEKDPLTEDPKIGFFDFSCENIRKFNEKYLSSNEMLSQNMDV